MRARVCRVWGVGGVQSRGPCLGFGGSSAAADMCLHMYIDISYQTA